MQVAEAKEMVLDLMSRDLRASASLVRLDPISPDPKDEGKFALDGRVARVIRLFRFQWGRDEVIRGARIGLGHVTPPA